MRKTQLEAQEALSGKFLLGTSLFDAGSVTNTHETENSRVAF
jgi:hypothetical protein